LPTTKEEGDAFEVFAYFYLRFFAREHELVGEPEFPAVSGHTFSPEVQTALNLGTTDDGIDGVYTQLDGALAAVQCKFRANRGSISYRDLATFWSEAYKAEAQLVFTNASSITDVAKRRPGQLLVTIEQLLDLDSDFFDALHAFGKDQSAKISIPKKSPRPYQDDALHDIVEGFESEDRGKLIAACGIGKTLIALWVAEARNDKKIIFIAPNLHLIRQTLKEWSLQASDDFRFLAVCSDTTAANELDELSGAAQVSDIPTTTDAGVIRDFLASGSEGERQIIFSTYQSLPVVAEAVESIGEFSFDLAFFDEAHKTAGSNLETGFSIGLDDELFPCKKRLFMTATERMFRPRAIEKAEKAGVELFSMDQKEKYGIAFHSISFREAIEKEIICPYEIVIAAVSAKELESTLSSHGYVKDDGDDTSEPIETTPLIAAITIGKAIDELGVGKLVSFHSSVKAAKSLTEQPLLGYSSSKLLDHAFHVNGAMSPASRAQNISLFEMSDYSLLTNARCLIEGVDIPLIDGICFADPKTSLIDIVQAVGRALRKPWGEGPEKVAKIILPVVVDDESIDADLAGDHFAGVFNVIQALRDQDTALAEVIDEMNLQVSRGKKLKSTGGGRRLGGNVTVVPIGSINLEQLCEEFELRVAIVTAKPGVDLEFRKPLGVGERGGGADRAVRTMADLKPDVLESSLVRPTLAKFSEPEDVLPGSEIKVNNNNVSHARKLGVIEELAGRQYKLTHIGKALKSGSVEFPDVMRNQMLLYEEPEVKGLFPYRVVARFAAELGSVGYWDFLFGIYSSDASLTDDEMVQAALTRVEATRSLYGGLRTANEKNKAKLMDELNEKASLKLIDTVVWTDRTTAGNQFRYFCGHLALFSEVFTFTDAGTWKSNALDLVEGTGAAALDTYLSASRPELGEQYGEFVWFPPGEENS
jgi:superfamily II DNA or RNA helicase